MKDKYKVFWSEEDKEFVGIHEDFPSLSFLAKTEKEAEKGIYKLVYDYYVEENFPDDKILGISEYEVFERTPKSKGQTITVKEAKERFGERIISEIIDFGSAIIKLPTKIKRSLTSPQTLKEKE